MVASTHAQAGPFLNACRDGNQLEVERLLGRDASLVHRCVVGREKEE